MTLLSVLLLLSSAKEGLLVILCITTGVCVVSTYHLKMCSLDVNEEQENRVVYGKLFSRFAKVGSVHFVLILLLVLVPSHKTIWTVFAVEIASTEGVQAEALEVYRELKQEIMEQIKEGEQGDDS